MSAQIALSVQGQIISCTTDNTSDLFCKFIFYSGHEWSIVSGIDDGITQSSRVNHEKVSIWNYPIDIIYQSSKPSGWPQLIVAVYGENRFGNDTVVGYGAIHIPIQSGHHKINVPLFSRAPSNFLQRLQSWFSGSMPESISFGFIAGGESREIIKSESQGFITVTFDVVLSGLNKLDLLI